MLTPRTRNETFKKIELKLQEIDKILKEAGLVNVLVRRPVQPGAPLEGTLYNILYDAIHLEESNR